MPAINPARLKQQAALLAEHFDQPAAYVRSLNHLLDFYADRSRRPGRMGAPSPLLQAYKTRPPVLRQILLALLPQAQQDWQAALALCDALWEQPYVELRQLAAGLLGQVRPPSFEPVITRLEAWLASPLDPHLLELVLDQSLFNLRQEQPQILIELIDRWLASDSLVLNRMGLRALTDLVVDPDFHNIPVFFHLIQGLARSLPSGIKPEMLDLLAALARRSPQETSFFLRQTLETHQSPDTAWLIRQSYTAFPPAVEAGLRAAVRAAEHPRG